MRTLRATVPALLLLLLDVGILTGCSSDRAEAPAASRPVTESMEGALLVSPLPEFTIRARLELASGDLLYTSESDYPFTWFAGAPPASVPLALPLSIGTMRAVVGAPPDAPAEVISLDAFFARHIERVDPYDSAAVALVPRYVALRETIRRTLPGVQVFRIGAIQVHCYAVGVDREGHVVGLETIAIET